MPRPRREPRRPAVTVLRLGHRPGRDPRLTTHVALVARALGAQRLYLEPPDPGLAARIDAVRRAWGGAFEVVGVKDWKRVVREFPGTIVHLTMYGQALERVVPRLRRAKELLIIVGGAKVPGDLYRMASVNVAVGHQPQSEVGALALTLDRLLGVPGPGAWAGAHRTIVPTARGKRVRTIPSEAGA
ncbi:MAG: tRNA (cytidine(56)-2'-O)-methyltransferase [Thermoplasmata archaeon]|nr:tRNA (cytidine(56)-2'-O)-methyltransferase [Thermoplasmata archaeon]